MTPTSEPTATFSTRSSITSLWSNRHSRAKPAAPRDTPAVNASRIVNTNISRSSAKANGARHHQEATRKRDEEAEMWGFEAGMGIGAGKPVNSDKYEELRGRILGKRRRDVDGKGNEVKGKGNEKGKAGEVVDSDSEEEVGRSALGRKKKRRVDPARPSGSGAAGSSGDGKVEEDASEADIQPKVKDERKTEDEDGQDGIKSPPLAEEPPSSEPTKSKRKKKNKKKKKAAE